jgi:hypothetical protein
MARRIKGVSKHGKVMGRPTKYCPELAAKICDQVAAGGMLTKICEQDGMPSRKTVYEWQRADPDFRAAYARAREQWCEHYEEIVLELAFNEAGDVHTDAKGRSFPNHAKVARDRLKVDTMKWFMSKWAPRYADYKAYVNTQEQQPLEIKFSWLQPAPAPAIAPEPPKQLPYLPSVADEIDQAIVARLVQAIKAHVPRADDRSPNEVLAEVERIVTDALKAYYRT